MGDNELGAFLRARRESVTPGNVGLPDGPRRRTPGLRRAELATLAGVSVEYLTRLEQGRDRRPSPEILAALGDALRLTTEERVHLHRLVKAGSGGGCQAAARPVREVRPTVRALLDRLEPAPAMVVDRLGELLAWTAGFERLAGPAGLLESSPPSLPRFVFTDARALSAFPEWDRVADERAAELRAAASLGDVHARHLADELTAVAGARFRGRFEASAALPSRAGAERWAHPEAGELALAYESMELAETDEQRLVVYLAADDATAAALDSLVRPSCAAPR
ncbi:helix-turn-helix domain-containing protein [Nonomuraea muscovyensis]|uniref:Transcriptional regulator with XRE-family HTH domain n=1 Tax=Nonomuraea muscovyensis TaxID=1124761 RepID=A0A7X0EU57_9ACTN|nr:helix-turn-helix domain-containing protein [Nonomuraea muscovyensis]MBB6344402.1 transcriptional regulator with XRE-family HTH domain [Nonomuraea muscovyensis]MDF2705634.1 binding protein with helix-turn-helix domain [Nonomuraea muscovyensis]